jgi:hypothetical protein
MAVFLTLSFPGSQAYSTYIHAAEAGPMIFAIKYNP